MASTHSHSQPTRTYLTNLAIEQSVAYVLTAQCCSCEPSFLSFEFLKMMELRKNYDETSYRKSQHRLVQRLLVNRAAKIERKKTLKNWYRYLCKCITLKGGKQSKQNEKKYDEYSLRGSWVRLESRWIVPRNMCTSAKRASKSTHTAQTVHTEKKGKKQTWKTNLKTSSRTKAIFINHTATLSNICLFWI